MSFLLIACILANFHWGRILYKSIDNSEKKSKRILAIGIVFNLSILAFFKYTVFAVSVWNDLVLQSVPNLLLSIPNILLPVGISFYTFHNISYLIEIYRKQILPSRNLVEFAVYDLFFPLLLCGPIERPNSLLPQIQSAKLWNTGLWIDGVYLFTWGIVKKVVIADSLSPFVDRALLPITILPDGILFWVAIAFAFQVYADFSGYTDCARGLAKMLGYELMLNFRVPFLSSNPSEFWKRWHISLSSWLRDYLYIPLGGNRLGLTRQSINLMILWILGGLWHGATYGYLLWGIYCGLQVVGYIVIREKFLNFWESRNAASATVFSDLISISLKYSGVLLTFLIFSHGLLLFRVENPEQFLRLWNNWMLPWKFWIQDPNSVVILGKLFFLIAPLLLADGYQTWKSRKEFPSVEERKTFPVGMVVMGFVFLLFGIFEKREFFYFQF